MAKLFKRDFDLDQDLKVYDFYVKFNYEYPASTLDEIADYLSEIDFNENPKLQTLELKGDINGNIFVELDLGNLPDNIRYGKQSKDTLLFFKNKNYMF